MLLSFNKEGGRAMNNDPSVKYERTAHASIHTQKETCLCTYIPNIHTRKREKNNDVLWRIKWLRRGCARVVQVVLVYYRREN